MSAQTEQSEYRETPAELRARALAEATEDNPVKAEQSMLEKALQEASDENPPESQKIPETETPSTVDQPFVAKRFRPLGDKILLENIANAAVSTGGIVIPDSVAQDYQWAVVRGVGEGRLLENGTRGDVVVSLGDKVLYHKRLVIEIVVGGNKYYIAEENSLLIKGVE